jgi:hypothetical protein
MDYKLAAMLRDAGFPQGGKGRWIAPPDKIVIRAGDRIYVPTLEELIEVCGERFLRLVQHPIDGTWRANSFVNDNDYLGSTPTEAVARLWLARHANGDATA